MRTLTIGLVFSSWVLTAAGCQGDSDEERAKPPAARRLIEQIPPPLDLKTPPADATKTTSGLVYSKLVSNATGTQVKPTDTALVNYTGWRPRTGDTFFTTKGRGRAIALDIAHAAPGFRETLPFLRKGEKAVLWVPPGQGVSETLVYEVEVVDIEAPATLVSRAPSGADEEDRRQSVAPQPSMHPQLPIQPQRFTAPPPPTQPPPGQAPRRQR